MKKPIYIIIGIVLLVAIFFIGRWTIRYQDELAFKNFNEEYKIELQKRAERNEKDWQEQKAYSDSLQKNGLPINECFFNYSDSIITYEQDSKHLYSPIIRIHYSGKWGNYQIQQLDSMLNFAKRFHKYRFYLEIKTCESDFWENEKKIENFIEKKIQKRNLKNVFTSSEIEYHNNWYTDLCYVKLGYKFEQVQQKDSVYFIMMRKIQE
ncbi:MAG: hypothetical protein HXX18_02815 [Bacteroidetes bacterium]|nr:hypothetical protein [Bacteroidota bacterium]